MGANTEIKNLVLYDGVCKFCNSSVNFILEHERAEELSFTPLQSDLGQSLLQKFKLPTSYTDSLLFVSEGQLLSHSKAAFKISGFLKRPWSLISIFGLFPSFITDFFYNLVAKHRYRLMGQSDACMIPTPATKDRFLE